jgi:hypothetical protein
MSQEVFSHGFRESAALMILDIHGGVKGAERWLTQRGEHGVGGSSMRPGRDDGYHSLKTDGLLKITPKGSCKACLVVPHRDL